MSSKILSELCKVILTISVHDLFWGQIRSIETIRGSAPNPRVCPLKNIGEVWKAANYSAAFHRISCSCVGALSSVALFRCIFSFGTFFGIIRVYTVVFSDPLIATMFIHFCLKHLLYRPGKQLFQFWLNVSGGSDIQVGLTFCHKQLHQSISRSSNPCVLFMCLYLTSCGYFYW